MGCPNFPLWVTWPAASRAASTGQTRDRTDQHCRNVKKLLPGRWQTRRPHLALTDRGGAKKHEALPVRVWQPQTRLRVGKENLYLVAWVGCSNGFGLRSGDTEPAWFGLIFFRQTLEDFKSGIHRYGREGALIYGVHTSSHKRSQCVE
jgi:hypothetical protein